MRSMSRVIWFLVFALAVISFQAASADQGGLCNPRSISRKITVSSKQRPAAAIRGLRAVVKEIKSCLSKRLRPRKAARLTTQLKRAQSQILLLSSRGGKRSSSSSRPRRSSSSSSEQSSSSATPTPTPTSTITPTPTATPTSPPGSNCLTIEICGNGLDDNCNGAADEAGCLSVNSRITTGDNPDVWPETRNTEFWTAGEMIDRVDFGYMHRSAASGDTCDPDGDANDRDNSFGEHNGQQSGCEDQSTGSASWDFNVPEPGYYVLSFFAWSRSDLASSFAYSDGGAAIDLPPSNRFIEMYLVRFNSAGKKRIFANRAIYLFHSRLFKVRQDPAGSAEAHPRLDVSPSTLAAFRSRVNTGWIKILRDETIGGAEGALRESLSVYDVCASRDNEGRIAHLAVAYLATGDTRYAQYGIEALRRIVSLPNWMCGPTWSYLSVGELGLGIALGYDAFYDAMTPAQRIEILRLADRQLNSLFISSIHAEHRGDGSHWWSDPTSNNWNSVVNGGGLGTAALAFKHDDRYAAQWLEQAVKTQRWYLQNNYDSDGLHQESAMYANYGLATPALFYDALLQNESIDLARYNDVVFKQAYAALYFLEPLRWNESPFDCDTRWSVPANLEFIGPVPTHIFMAARIYNDGILQRYLRTAYGDLRAADRYHDYMGYLPRAVLAYGAIPDVPAASWNLPLGKVWPHYGRLVMRTGFEDTKDYYFAMHSGLYGSHGHADQSSFIIQALGRTLVDDNYYDNYDSTYQNAILVDGQGQLRDGWDQYGGSIAAFLNTSVLDFAQGDSTLGYVKNGVDLSFNKRNVIFARPRTGHAGYYLIGDHIKAPAAHRYQWGLHHQSASHTIQSLGNNNYRFAAASVAPFNLPAHFSDASLEIDFASPASTTYSIGENGDKLEVVPATQAAEEHFVALLFPTDPTHALPAVAKINTTDFAGFDIGTDRVLYSKGSVLKSYDDVSTDAKFTFVSHDADLAILGVFNGKQANHAGLSLNSSLTTNLVLKKQGSVYTLTLGNEALVAGTATVTIGGLDAGIYRYYLDGSDQGTRSPSGGSIQLSLSLAAKREVRLERQ